MKQKSLPYYSYTQAKDIYSQKNQHSSLFSNPGFASSQIAACEWKMRKDQDCMSTSSTVKDKRLVYLEQPNYNHGNKTCRMHQRNVSLIKLGDWIRFTTYSLKLAKNFYHRAVLLLKQTTKTRSSSYPVAAAALTIIIKFQHSSLLRKLQHLPARRNSVRHSKVQLLQAYEHQPQVLKAAGFRIPKDNLSEVMVNVCQRWTLYLRRNSRHVKLPLKYLQTGCRSEWQRRNLYQVAFLVDIINISTKPCEAAAHSSQEWHMVVSIGMVASAILLAGATNSCTTDSLKNGSNPLTSLVACFLRKCFSFTQKYIQIVEDLIAECVSLKLWEKLKHLPTQVPTYQSCEELVDRLDYICVTLDD